MADVFAQAGAGGNNCKVLWNLDFDDVANTVTIDSTHTHFDGSPCPDPRKAWITVLLNTSVNITVDLLTGEVGTPNGPLDDPNTILTGRQPFVQGSPGKMINAGPKTRTGVRLKISADRAALISFSTQYLPPA